MCASIHLSFKMEALNAPPPPSAPPPSIGDIEQVQKGAQRDVLNIKKLCFFIFWVIRIEHRDRTLSDALSQDYLGLFNILLPAKDGVAGGKGKGKKRFSYLLINLLLLWNPFMPPWPPTLATWVVKIKMWKGFPPTVSSQHEPFSVRAWKRLAPRSNTDRSGACALFFQSFI